MAKIALVDDHILVRRALVDLIRGLGHEVVLQADNGKKFIDLIAQNQQPDIVLLDVNMPEMDGYKTAFWIREHYPDIKVIALSMYDDEQSIIGMLRCGARGYILKDAEPMQLKEAIDSVLEKGFYNSEMLASHLLDSLESPDTKTYGHIPVLTAKEMEFLKLACTELTYKEIAERMSVSPRTIDSYRDILFEKLNIKSRIGLVLFAIRNGIVKI